MADNSNSSASTPLSVIIIGCGRVAEKHLKAISKLKGLELKAVVDVNPDSAKRLLGSVKGFANTKIYNDYKEAQKAKKKSHRQSKSGYHICNRSFRSSFPDSKVCHGARMQSFAREAHDDVCF